MARNRSRNKKSTVIAQQLPLLLEIRNDKDQLCDEIMSFAPTTHQTPNTEEGDDDAIWYPDYDSDEIQFDDPDDWASVSNGLVIVDDDDEWGEDIDSK